MRIILTGYTGHMGREVRTCAEAAENCEIVAGVDMMIPASEGICVKNFAECKAEADVIIDFSHHSMTKELLDFAEGRKLPVVLATTGQTEEEKIRIREAAEKIPVFLAANYSLGIAKAVVKTYEGIPVGIISVDGIIYGIECIMIAAVSVFGLVIDNGTVNFYTAGRKVTLEVVCIILCIPQTPFSKREE